MAGEKVDPCSSARADAACTHFSLDLTIDFAAKTISGSTTLTVEIRGDDVRELHLDGKDLSIDATTLADSGERLDLVEKATPLGMDYTIHLPAGLEKGSSVKVKLVYSTSPLASGVQWLRPEQTAVKEHPFMFTQCQAIHARSLMPCQDTPAFKCTYDATMRTPKGLRALMSAKLVDENLNAGDNISLFKFEQKTAIPTYLLAIVAGSLFSRDLSERCRVWGEQGTVDKAAYEFEEVEKMLGAAEELLGPYVWERYDMVVLPPSFPYGGMENPMLTFLTPTLLAGDRSLVNVVVHEIVHSWTGNLVTSSTWEHFWLNEGFTVFCERKILGRLEGRLERHLAAYEGLNALRDSVEHFGEDSPYTALCPKFDGSLDPDDVFSSVPYEKGSNFLFYLESIVGEEAMNDFLKKYVIRFSHKSITTDDFQKFFTEFFADKAEALKQVQWEEWYNRPGMPIVKNKFDDTLVTKATNAADEFIAKTDFEGFTFDYGFSTMQEIVFYDHLLQKQSVPAAPIKFLMKSRFPNTSNAELRFRILSLCMKANLTEFNKQVIDFLTSQGRMKFVRPLFRLFAKVPGNAYKATEVFKAHRSQYHNIAAAMLAKDLGL
ncbi:hypothetical protein PTSG_12699 [Salpingoeca rosetta]|uniref:Peptidase M1 leukotriene A4 hydrolase/aminopeptidase C-terminal domain-containing protein n=1 Tax=Salpingoeca rosetta (strain ATCC 50818 / BSB-021) TaxID=946362 RepID=F2UIG6_SALR5|nr:uncharacterized protein PTSG_12699 [Salpingoeca rosetta]EGD76915.1 hypothetical protein PTSG_12699 [Salpingoeca rosetta]|eukprot:XP_004991286.1 hypothetical protein PTSG_12699 [Salpingoeca rosetta]